MTPELFDKTRRFDWIELAVHGFEHNDNYEFAKLDKEQAKELILKGYDNEFIKGFKSPGWQTSQGTMEALKELGFWFATQYSDGRLEGDLNGKYQPKVIEGLKHYACREYPHSIHGHTWNCCGNGLNEIWNQLYQLPRDSEFIFIDDYINEKKD